MEKVQSNFYKKLEKVKNENDLKEFNADFLGKNGAIVLLMKSIKDLPNEDKIILNKFNADARSKVAELQKNFEIEKIKNNLETDIADITLPIRKTKRGSIHPLTKTIKELEDVFYDMGFSITSGFELEDDWHNFEALNFPKNHPARQMQDTFFLPNDHLLRTQCTSTDIREMERKSPPYKFVSLGKTFRKEMDATHSPMFSQVDMQYIDKDVSTGNLKYLIIEFCKKFFEIKNLQIRFRPSYFPFTTPSLEVDMSCTKEGGKIVKFGEGSDWCELGGSGFTHPNVIKNVKLNPAEWQGVAFGFGLERMAMLKYGVSDIRTLFEGDLRFLKHYSFNYYER
ncbi:MAG: phenylalanine--tRNA ligase subunit alpha [Rickettsiales bacterium]|nr:MAG: phenylalanine--tRNA ligase subunit alpha [Rickettsiales bacterium]